MKGKLPDKIRLQHILEAIGYIENFSHNKTKSDFFDDVMYRSSVERQLEIIGEAANNLSDDLTNNYSEIPWEKMVSFRNFLAHEYFGIDHELVWGIVEVHLPILKKDIEKILQEISS
jgi:uncharacterized protein with HEPN domain